MTEQQNQLRELQNDVRIVGTLKEVNLEVKPNKKDPRVKQIIGNIVVMVEDKANNRVHEHRVELFAKESSKLFKGYNTIRTEFKAADTVGREAADRVQVSGSIGANDYVSQDGQLNERNRVRGLFVNRVDEKALERNPQLVNDEAIAQIELVVENFAAKTDKEGIETGEYTVNAFTIGYGNSVIKLQDLVLGAELYDVVSESYETNSTGKLTFAMNNYAEVQEVETDPFAEMEGGFGVQVDISNGPITRYVRELRVIGGFPPYFDERALEEDDIKLAKQIRALALQELKNNVPETPNVTSGGPGGFGVNTDPFGAAPGPGTPIDISDDDLPF